MAMSPLEPESGIWYALCWLVLITRLASRRIHRGAWKHLQLDDYLIVAAMATDTIVMAVMHVIVNTSSNLIAPGDDVSQFSQQEIDSRIYGSKLVLVVEQMQIVTIWLVKTCFLLMYSRMTLLLPQHKIVLVVAIYVALGFVIMEVLYLGVWCRPFNQYWAVPTSSLQCSAATNHLITNAVLNISSDLMIISIPIPLLFKVKLPKKNKAVLCGIFLIGTFTIVAAVLNKYYSFRFPFGSEWTVWYLRESYTAILCANLPLTYPLIQRIFRLRNWSYNSYDRSGHVRTNSHPLSGTRSGIRTHTTITITNSKVSPAPNIYTRDLRRTESEEEIYQGSGTLTGGGQGFITSAIEMGEFEKKEHSVSTSASARSSGDRR